MPAYQLFADLSLTDMEGVREAECISTGQYQDSRVAETMNREIRAAAQGASEHPCSVLKRHAQKSMKDTCLYSEKREQESVFLNFYHLRTHFCMLNSRF